MYIIIYTYHVKQKTALPSSPQAFWRKLASLWPALKGSVAQVRKPCIRPVCRACARGDRHPAYLLSFTNKGRRQCMYVPRGLVPLLQRALKNGRRIEELLYQIGPALIREHRQSRAATKAAERSVTSATSGALKKKTKKKS